LIVIAAVAAGGDLLLPPTDTTLLIPFSDVLGLLLWGLLDPSLDLGGLLSCLTFTASLRSAWLLPARVSE